MAIFTMPKSYDDVKKPIPMPAGIYSFITKETPKLEENKKKDGHNIVLDFVTFGDPDPEMNGRGFRYWIAMPKPGDDDKRTGTGQTFTDFKMSRIQKIVEALGGRVEGMNVDLPDTVQCKFNVIQTINENTQDIENQLEGDPLPL